MSHKLVIVFARCRKEERKATLGFQQVAPQDERVLALQKKLQEKQQERQRLKQTESNKAKTAEQAAAHTVTHTEKYNKVSMKFTTKDNSILSGSDL